MLKIEDMHRYTFYAPLDEESDDRTARLAPYPNGALRFKNITPYNSVVIDASFDPGIQRTLKDWYRFVAPDLGITIQLRVITSRLNRGWTFADAIRCEMHEKPGLDNRLNEKRVVDGVCRTMGEWCEEYDVTPGIVFKRMKEGMSFKDALTAPRRRAGPQPKMYEFKGESHSIPEWSAISGIPEMTLRQRLHGGWPLGEALHTPVAPRHYRS